ncbi:uncharacterized protein [Eurosta solidaginis]|uniref:uncharacterized protein n=1 Tax=Eurosta solidaginis TaxID=178769 RepID=UPI003530EA01
MSELQNVSCLGGGIQFWKDFIKIYENSPALWDTRSMAYKKPYLKREAYAKLRDKLREIDPNVPIDYVKRRINGLRSCYRRELRRIQESKRRGDDLYRPTLFYFKEMTFLDDVLDIDLERDERQGRIERRGRKPKTCKKLSKKLVQSDTSSSSDSEKDSVSGSTSSTSPKQAAAAAHFTHAILPQSANICSDASLASVSQVASQSESQTLGASWVALYQRLEREQQLYANKAIMEVLYQGALGRLHADSYKALDRDANNSNNFLDDQRFLDAINEELATDFITKLDESLY